jgi:hypothetical protein
MRLPMLLAGILATALLAAAAGPAASRFETVTVEPAKTSIYIGSVTLSPAGLVRNEATYSGTYTAKVFPFFFASEKGDLSISISDEQLLALARGEAVDFTGNAQNEAGEPRRVTGRATPSGENSGDLKVRIFVSRRIELVFDTTYRFGI